MSSGPIPTRPLAPPVAMTTDEERTAPFRRRHAAQLAKVQGKATLRRFVAPVHPQPSKRGGHRLTEADLDTFFSSLDRQLFPSSLAEDPGAKAIGHEFWAARQAAHAEVERRLSEERKCDESTLTAAERAISKAFLLSDRVHLLAFVGQAGVEPIELALALWQSHAHAWFALAMAPEVLWPKVAGYLSQHGSSDAVDHGHRDRRFLAEPARLSHPGPNKGVPLYKALLKDRE
jgi:hypothetical protein